MRFRLFACVVLGSGAISAGCYEASFPLDRAPQTDLPAGLLGSWRCLPADPDETDEAITVIVKTSEGSCVRGQRTSFLRPDVMAVQVLNNKAIGGADASPAGIRKVLEQRQDKELFEEASVCVKTKS